MSALLSLFNSGYDLTLAHPAGASDAKRLRQSLQIREQHSRQALKPRRPPRVGVPTTNPGAYCAILP
jgi:hypothetical protein